MLESTSHPSDQMARTGVRMLASEGCVPAQFFAVCALACGLVFVAMIPPFKAPDEAGHFVRAWYVSTGHFGAIRRGADVGFELPTEVVALSDLFDSKPMAALAVTRENLTAAKRGGKTLFTRESSHAGPSPVAYIPQAIGIALGRAAGWSPLGCFYAGRLGNLLVGVLLISMAVSVLPSYRWLCVLIALSPMSNHLRGSLSYDVATNGIAWLFLGLLSATLFAAGREKVAAGRWMAICILGFLLPLTKIVYAPLAFLPMLLVHKTRLVKPWRARMVQALSALLGAAIAARAATFYWAPYRTDVLIDPSRQLGWILGHPMAFAKVLELEFVTHAKWYLISMVGDLGAGGYTVVLPKWSVAAYLGGILVLLLLDTRSDVDVTLPQRAGLLVAAAGSAFGIALALYTTWCPVGNPVIDGLQGRYFLPIAPAAAFAFHRAARGFHKRWRQLTTAALVIIVNLVAIQQAVMRWYPR